MVPIRLTFDVQIKRDLSGEEISKLDTKLRGLLPELVGWSYSPLDGTLTLDFGEADETTLFDKAEKLEGIVKGVYSRAKKQRLEFTEWVKEW